MLTCALLVGLIAIGLPANGQSHILRVLSYWNPLDGNAVRHPARVNVSRSYMVDTCYVHAGSPSGPSRIYSRPDTADVWPYCYIGQTGEFLISIPDTVDGNVRVRLWMGPEALADTVVIDWTDVNTTVRCTIEQYVDMADSGWHCIDPWVHLNDPTYDAYSIDREDVRAVMEAEGLDAINCLDTSWDDATFSYGRSNDADLWNKYDLAVWFQSQIQDGVWGYVLPMRTSASPTVDGTLTAHLGQRSPGFMAERWYDRVDSLHGISILAGGHRVRGLADTTTANGARRVSRDLWFSPFDATLTNPDAFLLCEPLMGCPVDEANREAAAPNARSYKSWRSVLGATGDVLPACGGSNAALNSWRGKAAVGSWRTYVMMPEGLPASYYPVMLKRGHSYVTNGPLITTATLGDQAIGTTLVIDPGDELTLSVGIHGPHAADSLRIWLNGTVYSVTHLTPSRRDTTYTTDITFFGGADSRLWLEVIAKNDDDYLNWTEAQSDARLYAITNPWFIDVNERSLRQERSYTVYSDAKLDTINTLYVTTYDSWPDKHTTRSSVDSLNFVTSYAAATDITEERFRWVRTSARSAKRGTSEFPYDDYRDTWRLKAEPGDTVYHYAGYYTRQAFPTNLTVSNIVYRGFPEISRPAQVSFNMGTRTGQLVTAPEADDITFKWMCFRNATALADYKATFEVSSCSDWTFDHIWFKDYDCPSTYNNGCLNFSSMTGHVVIRDCVFDSLDGGAHFTFVMQGGDNVLWTRNRVTNFLGHETQPIAFASIETLTVSSSLWANVTTVNGNGSGLTILTPTGINRITGCTFDDVETYGANRANGVVFAVGADCATRLRIDHCIFTNSDSTDVVGFSGVAEIDSLSYTVSVNCTDWPPAAADTVGLLGTDPHFALTRLDRSRTFRPTDTRVMSLVTTSLYMGWTEARPPSSTMTILNTPFGSSVGGGGGGGDPKPKLISELPPPGG